MIETLPPRSTVGRAARETAETPATPWDYFAGAVVVVLGIVLGAVAALFVGLLTGWIQFC